MNLDGVAEKLDRFLYRRTVQKLTPEDLQSARIWSLNLIRTNHPEWSETQVMKYYDSLLNVRVLVVDEWGRRMQ